MILFQANLSDNPQLVDPEPEKPAEGGEQVESKPKDD